MYIAACTCNNPLGQMIYYIRILYIYIIVYIMPVENSQLYSMLTFIGYMKGSYCILIFFFLFCH